jgi:Spy/CpxP family protein refolding chaperone
MRKLIAAVLMVAAGGTTLWATEFDLPPGRWWDDQRLVERVGLSEVQQEQIGEIFYDSAQRMIDLSATVKKAGLQLAEVVDQKDFDPAAVRQAFAGFQVARQQLERERFEMLLSVRQVLTYEQWRKIQEIRRHIQRNRQQQDMQRPPGQRPSGQQPPGGLH